MTDTAQTSATRSAPRLERKALRDGVQDAVLEMLLDSHLEPGSPLSIDGLARQLGVSPTPVREALVGLERTGLVSRAALKGYRVAPPLSREQLDELVDARTVVELAALERTIASGGEFLPELREAHAAHAAAMVEVTGLTTRGENAPTAVMRRYFDADWEFHEVLLRASGNRYLVSMLGGLGAHMHRLRQAVGHGVLDAEVAYAEHAAVLHALEEGRGGDAMTALRAHLDGVRRRAGAEESAEVGEG